MSTRQSKRRAAVDICEFGERLFRVEGGRLIKLLPWERAVLDAVFGTLDGDGCRTYDTALIGLPKKSGKSSVSALVGIWALLFDDPEPEVYVVSNSREQSKDVTFRKITRAIERSPALQRELDVYTDVVERKDGAGMLKVVSAYAPPLHGHNASVVLWDELWAQGRDWSLWEAFTHSPTRAQPLHWITTYAGMDCDPRNLLWNLCEQGKGGEDEKFYYYWRGGEHDCQISPWQTSAYLARQRERLPDRIFRRLHWNEWTEGGAEGAIDPSLLDGCVVAGSKELAIPPGMAVDVALDLGFASCTAVTAGYYDEEDELVRVVCCRELRGTSARPVRPRAVVGYLQQLRQKIQAADAEISYVTGDQFSAEAMKEMLSEAGFCFRLVPFTLQSKAAMFMTLINSIRERRVELCDDPALRSSLIRLQVEESDAGLMKFGGKDDHLADACALLCSRLRRGAHHGPQIIVLG